VTPVFWEVLESPVQKWASIVRSTLFAVAQLAHGYTDQCTFAWAAIKLCKEDVVTAGPISGLEKRSSDTENGRGQVGP